MSSRLHDWINERRAELSDYEIAAGLDNGDIDHPDWLGTGWTAIGYSLWDRAESSGHDHLVSLDTTPDGYGD